MKTSGRRKGLAWVASLSFIFLLGLSFPGAVFPSVSGVALSAANGSSTLTWSDPYSMVTYRIPGSNNSLPWGIAAAPDGKIWFVEQGTNQLGSYDPYNGTFAQYDIPTPRSAPSEVAVDANGNVWFTELTANNLGELKAGGSKVVEIHIPPATVSLAGTSQSVDCNPGAVLPDPSGSIWVACLSSNQIDEFFPNNGTFARFNLPVFNSAPAGLALDGKGDLWFTAADADMLGKAVVSQLRNGTTDGITETAPINDTYLYTFVHATSFLGTTENLTSSLPTPSGIAIDSSGRIWITEHVDSSFDSFNPATSTLVKYWTSQTFDAYGYSVSFPNGIAAAANGDVWIGEHYGNRIALFDPSAGVMTEYPVSCCRTTIAGVYSIALDRNGTLWFVEISGNSIGELVKTKTPFVLSASIDTSATITSDGTAQVPINFTGSPGSLDALDFSASGVSSTGASRNLTATFAPANATVSASGTAGTTLTLKASGLSPGVYYLTVTAKALPRDVLYSAVLKLTVTESRGIPLPLEYGVPGAVIFAAAAVYTAWKLTRTRRRRLEAPGPSLACAAPPNGFN